MSNVNFEIEGIKYTIVKEGNYLNGRPRFQVYENGENGPEPFMTLTHNFPEANEPEEGYFHAKYWSENHDFFMKLISSKIVDFHQKEKESFYLSDKLMNRIVPIMTKIITE